MTEGTCGAYIGACENGRSTGDTGTVKSHLGT